ncbi:MAG: phosphatidate cytidylyltransferase [Oscillospiraceae bacterium]|jgi:phosphatidate cytidylyltransferase|nr:phosphatidate cytidylyltransferase [Oscillospiraceae bacterium]
MKTRILAAIVMIPFFFSVLFVFPAYILTFVISIIGGIAAYEFTKAFKTPARLALYAVIIATIVPFVVFIRNLPFATGVILNTINDSDNPLDTFNNTQQTLTSITSMLIVFFIIVCLLIVDYLLTSKTKKRAKPLHMLVTFFAGMILPYMISSLISLKSMSEGDLIVLIPVIITVFTDSGAYFVGVSIGKRKAFPKISPNKTIEGCIGGIIFGTIALLLYGLLLDSITSVSVSYLVLLMYGVICSVVAEVGDLYYSYIKRKCKIKDYGYLIPGHGGVLDRIDSVTFVAPIVYFLIILIPAIL